jgi:IclR family acetate operon transcriptional repressor
MAQQSSGGQAGPQATPQSSPRTVASVARALSLLEELRDSERGLGVNELARRIGVNASTASRLLATLEAAGMVQRNDQGPYRLGLGLVSLADRALARLDVQALARPVLLELMEQSGETATLSVPGEREAITVDSVPSRSSVVSMARLGRPSVPHATAVGKVMLAFGGGPLPSERGLVAFTDRTITDRVRLAAEIETVRERGYATVFGEREVDVNSIAAPVFDRAGGLEAILGLQGPAGRLEDPTRQLPLLREGAAALTRAIGGRRPHKDAAIGGRPPHRGAAHGGG